MRIEVINKYNGPWGLSTIQIQLRVVDFSYKSTAVRAMFNSIPSVIPFSSMTALRTLHGNLDV